MSKKLVLLGGGGHCKSVIDAALNSELYSEIVITDQIMTPSTKILGCTVVGNDDILPSLFSDGFCCAFITVGNIGKANPRVKLAKLIDEIGFEQPGIVDPSALIAREVSIGKGTFIGKNTVINAGAFVGNHCIINTGAIIEHDSVIGDFSHISVGSTICGGANIGRECMIGAGSTVIQGIKINDNTIVGAGAVVVDDIAGNCTAIGIPAKVI